MRRSSWRGYLFTAKRNGYQLWVDREAAGWSWEVTWLRKGHKSDKWGHARTARAAKLAAERACDKEANK